jgi:hypothetical protein
MGRQSARTRAVPNDVVMEMHSLRRLMVARIASRIDREVGKYETVDAGAQRMYIMATADAGLTGLLERLVGKVRLDPSIDRLFRELGQAEAMAGHSLEKVRMAIDIGVREAWTEFARVAKNNGLVAHQVTMVVDTMFDHAQHLRNIVEAAHRAGIAEGFARRRAAMHRLSIAIFTQAPPAEIEFAADEAGWPVPEEVFVARFRSDAEQLAVIRGLFEHDVLVQPDADDVVVIGNARHRERILAEIAPHVADVTVAVGITGGLELLADAVRHTRRALWLVDLELIPDKEVVYCEDYAAMLWFHAEPRLHEMVRAKVLEPLAKESRHRRRTLEHTLGMWLIKRESAPKMAETLGVHPQTARHHLRHIQRIFADRLDDREFLLNAMLALSTPQQSKILENRPRAARRTAL